MYSDGRHTLTPGEIVTNDAGDEWVVLRRLQRPASEVTITKGDNDFTLFEWYEHCEGVTPRCPCVVAVSVSTLDDVFGEGEWKSHYPDVLMKRLSKAERNGNETLGLTSCPEPVLNRTGDRYNPEVRP